MATAYIKTTIPSYYTANNARSILQASRQVAPDGAWTWFNDERAVFHQGHLYIGYVLRDGRCYLD